MKVDKCVFSVICECVWLHVQKHSLFSAKSPMMIFPPRLLVFSTDRAVLSPCSCLPRPWPSRKPYFCIILWATVPLQYVHTHTHKAVPHQTIQLLTSIPLRSGKLNSGDSWLSKLMAYPNVCHVFYINNFNCNLQPSASWFFSKHDCNTVLNVRNNYSRAK